LCLAKYKHTTLFVFILYLSQLLTAETGMYHSLLPPLDLDTFFIGAIEIALGL